MPTYHLTAKVWNFATVLRDDGVSYRDSLEQITFLLFLKMAHELEQPPYNRTLPLPTLDDGQRCDWAALRDKRGNALETLYIRVLRKLGTEPGLLG